MDAEEQHCYSSSQSREEALGLWPSIRSPWINRCVPSLFREFSPQRCPACCPLRVALPWGSADLERGMGKSWNYRIREAQNHRTRQWEGERFQCQIWAFGLPPPHHCGLTNPATTPGFTPSPATAPAFWDDAKLQLGQHSKSIFGSVLI